MGAFWIGSVTDRDRQTDKMSSEFRSLTGCDRQTDKWAPTRIVSITDRDRQTDKWGDFRLEAAQPVTGRQTNGRLSDW